MSPKEKQAAAQQTFVFHGPLTKVSPAQQAVKRICAGDLSLPDFRFIHSIKRSP